ncbi:hypothetical protein GCM10007989_03710 [Devosia pacifica]|uniref:DUF983 domain-containing protein n=1 Tax=Devosia pacifica TaxID=1335967 RepID=A0A918VPM6_9HYPH|nr:DUF983 domain-containing protein [Devosia pacifica]GHA12508.1 hypothetical protein GCM10007989_03710 [Devosia pacifica]
MSVRTITGEERPLARSMIRGAVCKCPNCGEGKLFRSYLKVTETCSACGEALHHHRADDLPPYVAIFIVGHLLVAIILHMEMTWRIDPLTYLYTMLPLAIVLPLAMLPSIKGSIVGLQWSLRMHGFDPKHRDPADPDYP